MTELGVARPLEPGDEGRLHALFEDEYGPGWRAKTCVERYHGQSPWPAAVSIIEADGAIVGAQPAYDVPLWVAGTRRMCTVLVDVVTHRRYRRRGIFSALVDHAVDLSARRGASLAMTTPNKLSYPGFVKKPDWRVLTTLKCSLRLLSPHVILERRLRVPARLSSALDPLLLIALHRRSSSGHVRLESETALLSATVDRLWRDCAPATGVSQIRNSTWMSWRFGTPADGSSYTVLTDRAADGSLGGYIVTRLREVGGVAACVIVDALSRDHEKTQHMRLLDGACDWARAAGAAMVLIYTASAGPWPQALSRAGFRRVPGALDPRPCHVCVRIHPTAPESSRLADPASWRLMLADSDLA